ncbi:rubredoxin-NAD+ reductase [Alkalispirillum mobile]|uniref:Rubredoxin-NAD+ reductase n=1 Tax=Alkalispirillum mobile TaxID=85925 RepID=A0A498CC40_9GAMM|nr:FAD-dependent oxidoreductase [Alkalispirillum mobile]RLK50780.1 rubredoxin-NAD+ reductase [Alkalispirillum mobile]
MSEQPYRRYLCRTCGFIYDEAKGDPDGGLPPGTRYEDIPDDWECPDCGVSKADFELLPEGDAEFERAPAAQSGTTAMDPEQVVIVGGGMAAWAAAEAIRARDPERAITLIARCNGDVYPKPQLSAAAARRRSADDLITQSGPDRAATLGVGLMARTRVLRIDTDRKRVITPRGGVPYGELVLASGAHQPKPALRGDAAGEVLQVNDLVSYRALRSRVDALDKARVLIMGAGLIGCEFADDLSAAGHQITLVDLADRPLARLLPEPLSAGLTEALAGRGVALRVGHTVEAVERAVQGDALRVRLNDGQTVTADVVVSALGLQPNIELARRSGLAVDKGIRVDASLRTTNPHVFALGDCSEHDGRLLPYVRPLRAQAEVIADNLTGTEARYHPDAGTITIKTPAYPLVVFPPTAPGEWQEAQREGSAVVMEHRGRTGRLNGFALSGAFTREASHFESRLGQSG